MNEYFTWEAIATYAGAVLAVTLITQFIKGIGFIDKIPTRITAYVVAVVVMTAAMFFTGSFSWANLVLNFINAVIVALAANGAHDALAEKTNNKLSAENEQPENTAPPDEEESSVIGLN